MILLVSSLLTSGHAAGLESLRPQIYAGTPIDLALDQTDVAVRYQLPATMETSMSFANIPPVLDLSYLSIAPARQQVSAMGNLVEGDSGSESYVHAVKAILVTWAPASDWPEWAARDSAGYSHEIEAAIYEVERNGAGTLTDFEPLIASRSLVHVPWRPTEAPDGSPYPYNGHAFEVTIPFVESVELPNEYVVLISYNTEFQGANPLGEAGPYNALNYGLSRSEVRSGNDPDPSSLVLITPQGWNYSASWGGLGSVMTEVVTRPVREMEGIPSEQPARVGEYLTAFYEEGEFVEQATVRILPRPITVTALQQERVYGEAMVLDETAFAVTDLDGDSVLPNGEVIETVALNSATGVDISTTSNVGTYADEIAITGQSGSNGFSAGNYDLSYLTGDLVVNPRVVTLTASQQERAYGDTMVLDETAFTITDLDGDSVLPNGEVIETAALNSATGVDLSTTSNVGTYADEIAITAQAGSNGFSVGNYDLIYVAADLVVSQRAVTLTASQQSRAYGDTMVLDETAFTVTDLDGDSALPNGELIDTVILSSDAEANVGTYADAIAIAGQAGSNGFSSGNYELTYVAGNLVVNQRAVTLTALTQERIYGDAMALDETAFTVTDLDGDSALPNGEVVDTVTLNTDAGANVGVYAAAIAITGQAGSNGFSASNYDLSYVSADLVVNQRAVTLTASQQERIYGDATVLDETAFTVTDLDGDSALPNGEVIDIVVLNSATGVDISTTSNVGTYAAEIAITGQVGSSGFSVGNYDLSYVAGDLVVSQRAVTLTASEQNRAYGDTMVLDETAFTVTDLDGDSALPNGEVIDTVILNSDAGGDVGAYGEAITITGQSGSNGFSASNYDLTYVAGDLVVNPRAVTLTALPQDQIYGDTLVLDETAFTVTDLDGDNVLPNGEVIDTVTLSSVTGVDITATSNVGAYADEIEIMGQSGSNGFSASNYDLSYVTGDLVVIPRAVTLTAFRQERNYGETMILDDTAFSVTDLDGDSVLPNEEMIDAVTLNSRTGIDSHTTAEFGVYADEIEITGQAGSNGFDADNYELSYVTGDLAVVARTYEGWIRSFLESGSISPLDDPDLDGLTNLMEYALGSNPLSGTGHPPVEVSEAGMFSGQISADLFATTVVLERSYDLRNWLEITPDWQENGSLRSWEWSDSGSRRVFVRVRVQRTP